MHAKNNKKISGKINSMQRGNAYRQTNGRVLVSQTVIPRCYEPKSLNAKYTRNNIALIRHQHGEKDPNVKSTFRYIFNC